MNESSTARHCSLSNAPLAVSRRRFLKLGIGALSVLAALEAGGASLLFLRSSGEDPQREALITAGRLSDFPPGSVTEFPDARFYLLRTADGGFLALYNRCPHLGCTVTWQPEAEVFLCPCHASRFDRYGNFEAPPVPRPLDRFVVQIEDDVVKVDISRPHRRERFTPEQLTYG
jgi:cytochrome b6-f complex iron-sulfur subunit